MEYTKVDIVLKECNEEAQDIVCALLGAADYDSFEYTEEGVSAYIPTELYDEAMLAEVLAPVEGYTYTAGAMEHCDWNAEWERTGFDPVLEREFGIKLDPRMAFGSGSHETTHQLVSLIMNGDYTGQHVLDMGCGTGVLGIAMALRGAEHVQMIDIDPDSVNNAGLNSYMNGVSDRVDVLLGDASSLDMLGAHYDTIVANIHKNILIADMPAYVRHLKQGGTICFSGFFTEDVPDMETAITANGLEIKETYSRNDWTVLVCENN